MQNAQDTTGFKRRSPISLTPTYLNRYRHYRNFCRCADLIRGGFHIDIYVAFASIYILHLFLNGNDVHGEILNSTCDSRSGEVRNI